ncbi:plant intracellular Ras-group-related LRR protein 6-like isoform X1 [Andrographis paniculata]|uniref:plant intracellular Ras-group-related LRR protein 6-like isoform X1 n=1 Tax=Andrographis paniculata TaxID=175694 RepID=UPI0021E99C32|nr:plant intracellular Ras-group-related LRR protein 6-like isoform X1 [Andrographis paniculata]
MMYEQQQQIKMDVMRGKGLQQQEVTARKISNNMGLGIHEEEEDDDHIHSSSSSYNMNMEIVDLSGMSLDTLPNPPFHLANICKLDLSNNNLQKIPESLTARLLNVMVLDVRSNQLRCLPNSIGCLTKLKILNVSGNLIHSLPTTIGSCTSLEELNANFNQLRQLPDSIGFDLQSLKKLSVNSNKLVLLPRSTSHLTNLRILDARLNCLRALPDDLDNLINLQVLNVSQNFQYLSSLPYTLGFLISLVDLDVSYNNISFLPHSIGSLKKLHKLCVEGNPLVSPPPEVIEQGLPMVKEYLCEKNKMNGRRQGVSPKKKSWFGKLTKCGTFSGVNHVGVENERDGYIMPSYRSIDGMTSPRYMGMFSPRRLFSPKSYFSR